MTTTQIERLRLRAHRAARAQYLSGKRAATLYRRLGVPVIVLTTVVGTSLFATLASSPSTVLVVATGSLSLSAAVLSSLQTFFSYQNASERHREAGARYSAVKRKLDLLLIAANSQGASEQILSELSDCIEEFNQIEVSAPDVSDRFYDRAREEQERDREGV